jgi:hypothetical protein
MNALYEMLEPRRTDGHIGFSRGALSVVQGAECGILYYRGRMGRGCRGMSRLHVNAVESGFEITDSAVIASRDPWFSYRLASKIIATV